MISRLPSNPSPIPCFHVNDLEDLPEHLKIEIKLKNKLQLVALTSFYLVGQRKSVKMRTVSIFNNVEKDGEETAHTIRERWECSGILGENPGVVFPYQDRHHAI